MSHDASLLNCLNPDKLSSHYVDNTPSVEETVCFAFLRHRKILLDIRAAQQKERGLPASCAVEGQDSLETLNLDANLATIMQNIKLYREELRVKRGIFISQMRILLQFKMQNKTCFPSREDLGFLL